MIFWHLKLGVSIFSGILWKGVIWPFGLLWAQIWSYRSVTHLLRKLNAYRIRIFSLTQDLLNGCDARWRWSRKTGAPLWTKIKKICNVFSQSEENRKVWTYGQVQHIKILNFCFLFFRRYSRFSEKFGEKRSENGNFRRLSAQFYPWCRSF